MNMCVGYESLSTDCNKYKQVLLWFAITFNSYVLPFLLLTLFFH